MHQQDTINEEYKIIRNKYILNNKKSDFKFPPCYCRGNRPSGLLHHEVGQLLLDISKKHTYTYIFWVLCSVDRASLYNLVNKAKLVY
jgi:hypothetical protein